MKTRKNTANIYIAYKYHAFSNGINWVNVHGSK